MTNKEKSISVEYVKSVLSLNDDAELAVILGVSAPRISQYRTGNGIL